MTKTRQFRRSETREVLLCQVGNSLDESKWFIDLAPGTKESVLRDAQLERHPPVPPDVRPLFSNLTEQAWRAKSNDGREMTSYELQTYLRVSVPVYNTVATLPLTYTEFTGFTRGTFDDLFSPFGKS